MSDQTVVATATADGGLRTKPITCDLKGGVAVVIQPAHQAGIQPKGDPQGGQALLHSFKALAALKAESISQGWCVLQQSLSVLVLRIQDAKGIGAEPGLGIEIQCLRALFQPTHQRRAIGLAILGRTQAVELKLKATHPKTGQQIPGKGDHLNVAAGALRTEPLHTDLVKLTLAPGLGTLVTEHRACVPKLLRTLTEQTVLQRSPHHRRCTFRAKRAGSIAAILEAVHLLADHIGGLTDPPTKQIGCLQQRRADLTETGTTEMMSRLSLNGLPALKGLRKKVHHAPETLELTHVPDARTTSQSAR